MNNTIVRSISGIAFVAVIVTSLLVDKFLYAGLVVFFMAGMMSEFFKISLGEKFRGLRLGAIGTAILLFALLFAHSAYSMPAKYISLVIIPVIGLMISTIHLKDKSSFTDITKIFTALVYISTPMALSTLLAFNDGVFCGLIILDFFIIIWASDVGGYCFGMALGQKFGKKLSPTISPKKSWIGFWGGLFFTIVSSLLMKYIGMIDIPAVHCVILAIIMNICGVYGDLFESLWKRHYNIKDSGNIIPGHGGLLDRFDSSLLAMPAGAVYLLLFSLI